MWVLPDQRWFLAPPVRDRLGRRSFSEISRPPAGGSEGAEIEANRRPAWADEDSAVGNEAVGFSGAIRSGYRGIADNISNSAWASRRGPRR
jgi:hypothetical protein